MAMTLDDEMNKTLGAAFFTFVCGCILYGMTLSQVYQYFRMYSEDGQVLKATVSAASFLPLALHLTGRTGCLAHVVPRQRAEFLLDFASGAKWVLYFAFSITCVVDIGITIGMCVLLHKSKIKIKGVRIQASNVVISKIIIFFISSGLLTSALPDVLLFIGATFSTSKLYANSVLAMLNGRRHLRSEFSKTHDIELTSSVQFNSQGTGDSSTSPFQSPVEEKKRGRSESEQGVLEFDPHVCII
ncbi:hypothetical protein AN958_08169 [Leucoagaricus sp. SymC.cos]|nr:hypothetical protein AN958_08169 [Leucoagaricus sp. SymC.cos]